VVDDNPILLDECSADEVARIEAARDVLIDACDGFGFDVNTLVGAYVENLAHLIATISDDPRQLERNIYRATYTIRAGAKAAFADGTDVFQVVRRN